jgi:DNA-binding GntR family transcriptional regulator
MKEELDSVEVKRLLALFGERSKVIWTLPEQIAEKLGEDIIQGVFAPGQPLLETVLAEKYFHVSRGPVREALRILEREGLVENRPRRGAIVAELSPVDVKEIFDVREVLYGFVTAQLARAPSDEILAELKKGTGDLHEAFDSQSVDEFLHALYRLSMYLAEAAGNSRARFIIVSHGRQTLSTTRSVMQARENRRIWTANWESIVRCIEARDVEAAEKAGRALVHAVYVATAHILEEAQSPAAEAGRRKRASKKAV